MKVMYNISFLILNLTRLVSWTIQVVLTAKRSSKRELVIDIVEGLVVILFLSVLTHALIVLTRADDFVVDYNVSQETLHRYEERNITVRGFFERRDVVVGKRNRLPMVLITTEVLAITSTLVVVGNIFRLLLNRRRKIEEKHDDMFVLT